MVLLWGHRVYDCCGVSWLFRKSNAGWRGDRKTKKLSEIENRRFALVGKRSEQYGGWSAGLAWLPLSGTVKEDRGKALPTLCPNLAQGLDIFGGHIPGC